MRNFIRILALTMIISACSDEHTCLWEKYHYCEEDDVLTFDPDEAVNIAEFCKLETIVIIRPYGYCKAYGNGGRKDRILKVENRLHE